MNETEPSFAPLSAARKAYLPTDEDVRHAQIDRSLRQRELALRAQYQAERNTNEA